MNDHSPNPRPARQQAMEAIAIADALYEAGFRIESDAVAKAAGELAAAAQSLESKLTTKGDADAQAT